VISANLVIASICAVVFVVGLKGAQKTFMPRGVPRTNSKSDEGKPQAHEQLLQGRQEEWDLSRVLWAVLDAPDEVIAERAGLDGVLYLRLQVALMLATLFLALLATVSILPANLSGEEGLSGAAASESYNIKSASDKYWVHALYVVVASFTLVAVAFRFRHFVTLLHQNIPVEWDLGMTTVKILGLPKDETKSERLKEHFEAVYPGAVAAAHMAFYLLPLRRCPRRCIAAFPMFSAAVLTLCCCVCVCTRYCTSVRGRLQDEREITAQVLKDAHEEALCTGERPTTVECNAL